MPPRQRLESRQLQSKEQVKTCQPGSPNYVEFFHQQHRHVGTVSSLSRRLLHRHLGTSLKIMLAHHETRKDPWEISIKIHMTHHSISLYLSIYFMDAFFGSPFPSRHWKGCASGRPLRRPSTKCQVCWNLKISPN